MRVRGISGSSAGGFTLIEVMVVIVVISLLAVAVVINLPSTSGDRMLEREVNRLTALLQMASEEALFQGRDLGLHIDLDSYSWHQFDPQGLNWIPLQDIEQLRPRELPELVEFELVVEGRGAKLTPSDKERRQLRQRDREQGSEDDDESQTGAAQASTVTPQVMVLASGELTPFALHFQSEVSERRYTLTGQPFGALEITEEEGL
ncbi:MAG: type II secretion system minor pseudopilin GspH [Pseudomonadota bacterium]